MYVLSHDADVMQPVLHGCIYPSERISGKREEGGGVAVGQLYRNNRSFFFGANVFVAIGQLCFVRCIHIYVEDTWTCFSFL